MIKAKIFLKNKYFIYSLILIISLIKIPPFYLIPFLKISLLTSHNLSKILVFINLLIIISFNLFNYKNKIKNYSKKPWIILTFVYFLLSFFSIINVININSYLERLEDTFFIFINFFLFLIIKNLIKKNIIFSIFFYTSIFNIIYQFFLFFHPNLVVNISNFLLYDKYLNLLNINLLRKRLYLETYDEINLPIILINSNFLITIFYTLILSILAFISNFRSRILMLTVSFFSLFFIKKTKNIFIIFLGLFFIIITSSKIMNYYYNFSIIDRIFLNSYRDDIKPLIFRLQNIYQSYDMILKKPLLGVGLGNYYDNLPIDKKIYTSKNNWENEQQTIATSYPHNIFLLTLVETGFINFTVLLTLIIYFFIKDFNYLFFKNNLYKKSLIISFWSLFSYAFFNPTPSYSYNLLFWLLRILID